MTIWLTGEYARIAVSIGHVALINWLMQQGLGRKLLWPLLALLAGLLAACAAPDRMPLGSSRDETLARLGPPTAVHRLPDGERLQYSYQPAGPWVHNLDFDANGRLRTLTQEGWRVDYLDWFPAEGSRPFMPRRISV